jgi:hypothetical protein
MTAARHRTWLTFTAISIAVFGPVFSLGAIPAIAKPARWSLDLLGWQPHGAQTHDAPAIHFLTAITGGFRRDSAGSIVSGNASNAGLNVVVLLILVGPLWWPATGEPG